MKTSVIRQRVADFLRRHAPFDSLEEQDLLELAGSGKVKFHESEEYLFRQGDGKGAFVWTIQQGRVELLEESGGRERLRDVLGEGDLLGLERFEGEGRCRYSARTASDVILYGVAGAGDGSDGGALPGAAALPGGALFGERGAGVQPDIVAGCGGAFAGIPARAAGRKRGGGAARDRRSGGHAARGAGDAGCAQRRGGGAGLGAGRWRAC